MTPVERLQLKNKVQMVLHAPGGPYADAAGQTRGSKSGSERGIYGAESINKGSHKPALEMTLIFDGNLSKEAAAAAGAEIITTLKQTDEIFRNVRLNAVRWMADDRILREVTAAPLLQMGRYFEDYEQQVSGKRLDLLAEYLKKFDARSRLLLLVTDGKYRVEDTKLLHNSLNPFLYRRILLLEQGNIKTGRQLL